MSRNLETRDDRCSNGRAAGSIDNVAADWVTRRDAGLNDAEHAELQAWLAANPRHHAALARYDSAWTSLDRAYNAGAAEELLREVNVRAARRRRRTLSVSITAGLAVLLSVGAAWRLASNRSADHRAVSHAAEAVILLPKRQTLPDGSVVELRNGAEITVDFSAALRRVVLQRGEAHFQVTKNPNRPFVVVANGVEARAVGTAFSVQLAPRTVEVLVTEGRVAVDRPAAAAPGNAAPAATPAARSAVAQSAAASPFSPSVLGAGQLAVVAFDAPVPQVTAVPAAELDERLAWRAPRVEFTRTSLADAIALLNEHSALRHHVRFTIVDPSIAQTRVSGLFRVDKTEAFVALLKQGFGIDAEYHGEIEIVLRKAQ